MRRCCLANATGIYGSYGATTGDRPGPSPGGPPRRGPPGRGGGSRGSPPTTRNETFLRGGWHTNENGIVELTTIFPGFYAGRAPHIHTMVHKDWVMSENG
jgi:protocatechuate 3,4-dioxygenase beta subunit